MSVSRNIWSKEELIVALSLYFQLPFGRLNHTTKEVIELAGIIGRTPNSVALRLSNYAACDPYIINSGRKGMQGGVSVCMPVWKEYEKIIKVEDKRGATTIGFYERFEFYRKASEAYLIIVTGEKALYANVMLQKGVL